MAKDLRFRSFAVLGYIEGSTEEKDGEQWSSVLSRLTDDDYGNRLEMAQISVVWILHDKDRADDEDAENGTKKAHFHMIWHFPSSSNKKSEKQFADFIGLPERFVKGLDKNGYESMLRYLIHLEHFSKYQYPATEVCFIGSSTGLADFERAINLGTFKEDYCTPDKLFDFQSLIMERNITTSYVFIRELCNTLGFSHTTAMAVYAQGKRFFDTFFREASIALQQGQVFTQTQIELRTLRERNKELRSLLEEHGVAYRDLNLDYREEDLKK